MKTPLFSRLFPTLLCAAVLSTLRFTASAAAGIDPQVIRIATARSAMTLMVATNGRVYQLDYGSSERTFTATNRPPARETEFHPQGGDGFILEPALQATHADGNTSTDLIYVKHNTSSVDDNVSLTRIELKDPAYPFFVTLCLKSYAKEDMIEQWTEIRHEESSPVTLYRFASAAPILQGREFWLSQFAGDYKREAGVVEEKLSLGMKVLDSRIGVRASRFRIPSFMISLNGPANEEKGQVYGGSLKWSGSFQLAFDVDRPNRVRMLCGINPAGSQYRLKPGQTFAAPAMLWTWSNEGKGQVSRNFHHWAAKYGIRDAAKPRPILMNNWEATGMTFNEERIVALFDGGKEIGTELFLLDDGWFGNANPRDNDRTGLGDWQVNAKKLPRGLSHLADEAKARGLRFGIWLEPEMVNPRSDLYGKHPEWAIVQAKREPELSRYQLVLDLTRPEVREFAWKVIDDTLKPNPGISYVKWDANRFVTQPGSSYLPPEAQAQLLVDYNFALYDIMGRLATNFPNVMTMVCAGGGGRVDYGALKYFHSFWPSDQTDPLRRVSIQWGFSHHFPASTISAHVTRMGNRPLKFAIDVALSGAFGVDMDLGKASPEDRKVLAAATALYKERLRDVVLQGDLYRLESPYDHPRAALDYVSADRSRAVLFVYQTENGSQQPVKARGLDPQRQYRVKEVSLLPGTTSKLPKDGQLLAGTALMQDGLVVSCSQQCDSVVIELVAE